jgi:signal transduction histidine kinase
VGPMQGAPDRLQQVVWNIVTNAVKFTPRGGRIDVVLRRADSYAEVVVTDRGEGISPDVLPHVFQEFWQEDNSTTRTHQGLGLGLTLVKHLVELHGGHVRAESAGKGRGATFTVALPLLG